MTVVFLVCLLTLWQCLPSSLAVDHSLLDTFRHTDTLEELQTIFSIPADNAYLFSEVDTNTTSEPLVQENCTAAFQKFSVSAVRFTNCTIRYARPIHICMECGNEYNVTTEAYEALKKESEGCHEYYFGSDQLGIIDIIYNGGLNLWKKSRCQSCYDYYSETEKFFNISDNLFDCIQDFNKSYKVNTTCEHCNALYGNLSDSYKKFVLRQANLNSGICMDIVDTMNITRKMWKDYNCVAQFDTSIGYPNVITSVLVGILPIFFYLLVRNITIIEDVKIVRPKRKFISVPPM